MNIFQKSYNWFKNLRTPKWLKELTNNLWFVLREIISESTEIILAQIQPIAIEVCRKIQDDHSIITNENKRRKAFEEITILAKAQGLETKENLINMAITVAVAFLKKRIS